MFLNATNFDDDISSWSAAGFSNTQSMFMNATSFNNGGNPDINYWSMGNVTFADSMFENAISFQQPINEWDLGSLIRASNFMAGKSSANYPISQLNSILLSWSSDFFWDPLPGVIIDFGDINYTSIGAPGYNILTGTPYNWLIESGGRI
jgi:hypothetical protein